MESPRDPLPAYLSAEPDPADPRPPRRRAHRRPGTPRPRPACWAVLVVLAMRRPSHEARAALARGGITYWNPGSITS